MLYFSSTLEQEFCNAIDLFYHSRKILQIIPRILPLAPLSRRPVEGAAVHRYFLCLRLATKYFSIRMHCEASIPRRETQKRVQYHEDGDRK
jgi:hypothetical protein